MRRCSIKGCRQKHYALGMCRTHYDRVRAGRDMDAPFRLCVRGPVERRLKARLLVDTQTGCHVWTGNRLETGYGRLANDSGKQCCAHRLAWEVAHGPIPAGMFVCHHCDNRACCNPEHLYLGTAADNVRDRIARNRTKGARARDLARYPQWR